MTTIIVKMTKTSLETTIARHTAIHRRFKELEKEVRKEGLYNKIYLSSLYSQVGEELGYSENYVCKIIKKCERQGL